MTNSGSSTESSRASGDSGFQPWHFYMLLSLAGATWAVIQAPHTHPAALLLISAAVMAAGLVAATLHQALRGFFGTADESVLPLSERRREFLTQEKALVLRSIKELEFDKAMGKVGESDFAELSGRLRARAVEILEELEHAPVKRPARAASSPKAARPSPPPSTVACSSCATENEADARFCKQCGARLA